MKNAFSLVELSIVLVILGLLVGGVLTGQSLIRAAELRSVTTEFQQYSTATQTFRDRFFAFPGDMRNATAFWGETAACPGTAGTGTQTCDGDGDGLIEQGSASQYGEIFTFWQHLANAGLIEGSFTGIAGAGSTGDSEYGENVPRSKLNNAGWSLRRIVSQTGSTIRFDFDYGTFVEFGASSADFSSFEAALSPEETWNIDTKIDDGRPGTGSLMAIRWNSCTDAASSADALTASYALNTSGSLCAIAFPNGFGGFN